MRQEKGTNIVWETYEKFLNHRAPLPTHYLTEMLGFEESFLQKHGTALGMKIAVPFANIFTAEIEKKLIQQLKQNQTKRMETLHEWRFLPLGLRQKRGKLVH